MDHRDSRDHSTSPSSSSDSSDTEIYDPPPKTFDIMNYKSLQDKYKDIFEDEKNKRKKVINKLWIDEYRPTSFTDICGNKEFIYNMTCYVETNDLPNLIIWGSPGTGKKTILQLLAQYYLSDPENYINIYTVDANTNKNKDIINLKKNNSILNIADFIKTKPHNDKLKIIIINNFEEMTIEAQNALRSIIDSTYEYARFLFSCSKITGIIESLQNRLNIFEIKQLKREDVISICRSILQKKHESKINIYLNPDNIDVLNSIYLLSDGDIKKAINFLQAFSFHPVSTVNSFYTLFNVPSLNKILELLISIIDKNDKKFIILNELFMKSFTATDILDILLKAILNSDEDFINIKISSDIKLDLITKITSIYGSMDIIPSNHQLIKLISNI